MDRDALARPTEPSGLLIPFGAGLDLIRVDHGFGQLLPHRTTKLLGGLPSQQVIDIRSIEDLAGNVSMTNPILPTTGFPTAALLPNGSAGNHYIAVEFSTELDPLSVLTPTPQPASQLTSAVRLEAVDPATGVATAIGAVALVGGKGFINPSQQMPGLLEFEQHVDFDRATGKFVATTAEGLGFPYTEGALAPGGDLLVSDRTLVLVADSDGDLSTHETFPSGVQINLRLGDGVLSQFGAPLAEPVLASTTVGPDSSSPEVVTVPSGLPAIDPAPGAVGVSTGTDIQIAFTEPVQPFSVGPMLGAAALQPSPSLQVSFGPPNLTIKAGFWVEPAGPYDLATWRIDPTTDLPGKPATAAPSLIDFSRVDVFVSPLAVLDLVQNPNQLPVASTFETGVGAGLVNAPIVPDAILALRGGSESAVSVIDLNGFGAGTGDPTFDPLNPIVKGNSNYPNNPNLSLQGALLKPALKPGTSTVDGGSAGVFSLTRDSNLDDRLLRSPTVQSIRDGALGQSLDVIFNNGPAPFGCQVGGGNLCLSSGLKVIDPVLSGGVVVPAQPGQFGNPVPGAPNPVSWSPHPNPPPLVFPASCQLPEIAGQEPTARASLIFSNLLVPGTNALGDPALGVPPTNLLATDQNAYFIGGENLPQVSVGNCQTYEIRQQIGHFLYLADEVAGEIVVVNSNRFTVISRIAVTAPTSVAVEPNLRFLAVASASSGQVTFIGTDPSAVTFHQVIKTVDLAPGIADLVWQSDGEDLLVVNETTNELTLISAFDLNVRKVIDTAKAGVRKPFALAATNRQQGTAGLQREVYFAFVLGRNGRLAVFESGPGGANGFGADDLLIARGVTFVAPTDLAIDPSTADGAVLVAHSRPVDPATGQPTGQGGGALTRLRLTGPSGAVPLQGGTPPATLADRSLSVVVDYSLGEPTLTGVPTSIAFDEQVNLGALPGTSTPFAVGLPAPVNSKSLLRQASAVLTETSRPQFVFLAVPGSSQGGDVVDVIDLASLARFDTDPFVDGEQSIPVPGVDRLVDWFGQ